LRRSFDGLHALARSTAVGSLRNAVGGCPVSGSLIVASFASERIAVVAVHIGTSGWSYAHWTNVLYPEALPTERRLDYYVRQFSTVELNASYYRWPSDAAFTNWRQRLPTEFLLTVKAPRALTHAKRLYGPEPWLARIRQGLSILGPKRGVLLVQLPPSAAVDHARLAFFLERVPEGLRVCIEFRNETWLQDSIFGLLEEHKAAYCVMSGARLPCVLRSTAPFVYARLHGPDHRHLYAGAYSDDDLRWWADRVREWQDMGRDVFVYFNNDGGGNAVQNAVTLKGMVGA
jgi:uncharacterized protein YecE (DUF72 family)